MKKLLIIIGIGGILSSCTTKHTTEAVAVNAISVDTIMVEKTSAPILKEGGDTMYSKAQVKYLKLAGGNKQAVEKINEFLKTLPLKYILDFTDSTENQNITLEQAIERYINEPFKLAKENKDYYIMPYEFDMKGDSLLFSPNVISLSTSYYAFTGGAHGNHGTDLWNFDAQTGNLLTLTDIVKDTVALKKLVEIKFYDFEKANAKAMNVDFDKSMYFFGSPFQLPQNIGLAQKGLRLIYNPYEAAPYVRGQIVFDIPYAEINPLLNEKYQMLSK